MTKGKRGPYTAQDILGMKDKTDYRKLDAMHGDNIDFSDIPELDDRFWKNVSLLKPSKKEMISLRVDKEIVDWFRKQGRGYQGYMNAVLRAFVETKL